MCDDTTEAENDAYLANRALTRRQMGMGAAGAAATALLAGCTRPETPAEPNPTSSQAAAADKPAGAGEAQGRMVTVDTPDGSAEAFFVAPTGGKFPGVVLWPDVAGLRDSYKQMATRLASAGYAVLAVNQYYRSSKLPIVASFDEWRTEAGKAKIAPMRAALTPEAIGKDGGAFVAWLDKQAEVDPKKRVASMGYCMGGPYTLRTAAAQPERVGAIASFHGGGLVTPEPSSPHQLVAKLKAAALLCIAQNDDEKEPEAKNTLKKAFDDAKLSAEIEVYPAQHGWCTTDAPVYDQAQAERAWARMLALFKQHL